MNVLFILRTLEVGGVEVVSSVLANKFVSEGHHVSVFAFSSGGDRIIESFDLSVKQFIGDGFRVSKKNICKLRKIIMGEKVDVIINQWGLPLVPIKVINRARKGLFVKVITVFHNDPLQNGRIQGVKIELDRTENSIKKALLKIKLFAYRCVTGYAMRYNYNHSDVFEVLSPSFVDHFKQFTKIRNPKKLFVQTNPITINNDGFIYDTNKKQKEIIYVGRVDYTQKRVHRVIEMWSLLEKKYPDWKLTVVGDGEERMNLEKKAKEMELLHLNFVGFQSPRRYYERASVLLLTSEYEGFPLVLAECMSFGVVPVVYDSYPALHDIVEDDIDGLIIGKIRNEFSVAITAEKMSKLMDDKEKLTRMAYAAIRKSLTYKIDTIFTQWLQILSDIY